MDTILRYKTGPITQNSDILTKNTTVPIIAKEIVKDAQNYVVGIRKSLFSLQDSIVTGLETGFEETRKKGKNNWQVAKPPKAKGREAFKLDPLTNKWRANIVNVDKLKDDLLYDSYDYTDLSTVVDDTRNALIAKDMRPKAHQETDWLLNEVAQWVSTSKKQDMTSAGIAPPMARRLLKVKEDYRKSSVMPPEALERIQKIVGGELPDVFKKLQAPAEQMPR